MPTAATKTTLAEALAAAQQEMPAVEPDAVNPHFRSRFVSLDNLIAKTRPVLNKHGLSISQWPSMENGLPSLTTRITHTSGESIEDKMPLFCGKQDMQALGAAITYARRYAWAAALGISADEDDDHEAATARSRTDQEADRNGNGAVSGKTASPEQVDAIMELAATLTGAGRLSVGQIISAAGGAADGNTDLEQLRPLLANLDVPAAAALHARLDRYAQNLERKATAGK